MRRLARNPRDAPIHAESAKIAIPALSPLLQLIAAELAAYPSFALDERVARVGHIVVAFPAAQEDVELADHPVHAPARVAARQRPHSKLEAFPGLPAHPYAVPPADGEAEERPTPRAVRGALRLVHLQLELALQETRYAIQHAVGRSSRGDIYVAIVRVANERMASSLHFLVETVQKDVRQERRQRSALRRPFRCRTALAANHDACLQVSANQLQKTGIGNLHPHLAHQQIVVHVVEELLQIQIDHPAAAALHIVPSLQNRLARAAARTEAEARVRKAIVVVLLKDLQDRLLYQAVQYRGDAQQTGSPVGLGQLHPQHRFRTVGAVEKTLLDSGPAGLYEAGQFLDGHAVDSCGPLVGLHLAVGRVHVSAFHDPLHQELIVRALGDSFRVDSFAPSIRGQPC